MVEIRRYKIEGPWGDLESPPSLVSSKIQISRGWRFLTVENWYETPCAWFAIDEGLMPAGGKPWTEELELVVVGEGNHSMPIGALGQYLGSFKLNCPASYVGHLFLKESRVVE